MSPRTRGAVASAGLVALAWWLPGCGGPDTVGIDARPLTGAEGASCAHLLDALPESLAGEASRRVGPADAPGAAWGDPPITLTCGASVPPEFGRFSSCVQASGVGWFVPESEQDDESSDLSWTAVGYRPVVRVDVPSDYRPAGAAAVIAELAAPVRENLRLVKPCR